MTDEVNGKRIDDAALQHQKAAAEQNNRLAQLNIAARTIMGVVVRGMLTSSPGVQPIDVVCAAAFQYGRLMGETFEGDLVTILGLRKQIKEAFAKGMNSVAPPAVSPPPADLVKRLNG